MILEPFEGALVGKLVSHVWRGYGSALFIEFGALSPGRSRRDGSTGNPVGEVTLMIEWSWRVERPRSIVGGSWSSERKRTAMLEKLKGASVTDLKVFGSLPEIEVSLSNDLRVVSFTTADGQPDWGIVCRNELKITLGVKRGKLHVEKLAPNPALNATARKRAAR